MPDQLFNDPVAAKLSASLIGSLISLRFIIGSWMERTLMFFGGTALSFYATDPVGDWIGGGPSLSGLIGFFLGLLGMTLVAKVYEALQAVDAKHVGAVVWGWIVKKWGA